VQPHLGGVAFERLPLYVAAAALGTGLAGRRELRRPG